MSAIQKKERSSKDDLEVLREIINENPGLKERILHKIRLTQKQSKMSLNQEVQRNKPKNSDD